MSGLLRAIRHLTVVPVPGEDHAPGDLGRAAAWFPVVGLGLGVLLVLVDRMMVGLLPPLPAAVLTVAAWKAATGGLHLDGLADCLDGLAGRDREHRLAIMRDSHIGTFGAAGLALVLVLEIVAVAELPASGRWRVLLAAPAVARVAPSVLARLFDAARAEGQGAMFVASVGRPGTALAVALALAVAFVALGPAGVVALGLALAAVIAGAAFLARRLGGLTGDVLGAAVEGAELVVVLTALAWLGAQA